MYAIPAHAPPGTGNKVQQPAGLHVCSACTYTPRVRPLTIRQRSSPSPTKLNQHDSSHPKQQVLKTSAQLDAKSS